MKIACRFLLFFLCVACHATLSPRQRATMEPYLLPIDHPIMPQLDQIFAQGQVTANEQSLLLAGFEIIAAVNGSYVTVAKHPQIPGYVFKIYLDSETRSKDGIPNCIWLTRRCIGAERVRKIIQKKQLSHFVIPDKWLYTLPSYTGSQPVILIATDMELESRDITEQAWKNEITCKHLLELFEILKHGYGTTNILCNIPYTKSGTFAFVDTEYPKRKFDLEVLYKYLSPRMQDFWKAIIEEQD